MKTKTTKYVVIRTTWSSAKCSYVRTVKRFDDEAEAIDWAERHSTRDHIACRVFAVECKVKEDGTVCYPCDWSKNALPSVSVENVGTLIYRKQGKEVHDFRESKETCANAEENSANANLALESEEDHVEAKEAEPEGADGKEEASGVPAVSDLYREPVRYYAVLLIAENRKQTKFHYKRKMFWDDQQAIDFARSRLRGGCRAAWVYMYDPVTVKVPPELFESDNPKRDTDNIGKFLGRLEIFRIDSHSWSDMRDRVYAEIREADKVQATA